MGVTTKGVVSIIFTPLVRGIESPQKQCCFRGLNEVLLSGTQTTLSTTERMAPLPPVCESKGTHPTPVSCMGPPLYLFREYLQ